MADSATLFSCPLDTFPSRGFEYQPLLRAPRVTASARASWRQRDYRSSEMEHWRGRRFRATDRLPKTLSNDGATPTIVGVAAACAALDSDAT